VSKLFKLTGFSLFLICWLASVLAACGEDTARPAVSPAPTTLTVKATASLIPATATTIPFTATPLPSTPVPTATPLSPTPTLVPAKADPVVGALPAPPQGRKLNLTVAMLQRLQKKLSGKPATTDLSGLQVGAYATTGQPVDVLDYYRAVMPPEGWAETHRYNNLYGIYFEKGNQIAIVSATGIPDETTVDFLAGFIPEVKGQVKGGEVLVLLGQGDNSIFEILIK
jgi:hypothetical protein